jgi:hypothetical protein
MLCDIKLSAIFLSVVVHHLLNLLKRTNAPDLTYPLPNALSNLAQILHF